MSLACLACHVLDSSPERTLRSYSDNGGRCVGLMRGNCWTRKLPTPPPPPQPSPGIAPPPSEFDASRTRQQQVVPVPSTANGVTEEAPGSPRLTRCHAVRRDLFRDWNFEEMSRQLCMNLSGTA